MPPKKAARMGDEGKAVGYAPLAALLFVRGDAPMDDDEIHLHVTYASHLDMDEAFCARMRMAIEAGLESASVGVITTPGTKNPKYVPTENWPLTSSSLSDMDF
jgi:hypothetical protein